jgi:hypothetical protein
MKFRYNTIDEVPETLRDEYEEVAEGDAKVFKLKLELEDGESVENVSGLKKALATERNNARAAARELEKLRSQYSVDDEEVTELRTKLTAAEQRAQDSAIDAVLKDAVTAARGNVRLLPKLIRGNVKVVDGDARIVDEKGNVRLGDDGKPLTIDAYVAELSDSDEYSSLFAGVGRSGGGSSGATGSKSSRTSAPSASQHRSKMTVQDKVAYINAHGNEAFQNLPY